MMLLTLQEYNISSEHKFRVHLLVYKQEVSHTHTHSLGFLLVLEAYLYNH